MGATLEREQVMKLLKPNNKYFDEIQTESNKL